VSRQGVSFDYSSPAELYLSRRRRRHTDYRRFATAAEAVRYAFEELRTRRSRGAWIQVGDDLFNSNEIKRLYYPLSESLSAAPVRPHEIDVSARLSVRIDLASGGHLGFLGLEKLRCLRRFRRRNRFRVRPAHSA
jgi:hypothetical protein